MNRKKSQAYYRVDVVEFTALTRLIKSHALRRVMCVIANLIVTPDSLPINIVYPQVTYPHRSEKLTNVPRMIVAEAPLTRRYYITNTVHTVPSFSYSRPD
ncbi:hypothetical protein ACTXT7_011333 [Hymenolepis weldensis]